MPTISETHYFAFGEVKAHVGLNYRYGFNGMEKSRLNEYTTLYRQLSTEQQRWWSVDPKATAFESPYVSMGNNPLKFTDVLGDSIRIRFGKERILYHNGNLFMNGLAYKGNAYDKKGNLTGFVAQTKDALDKIRLGGNVGEGLINFFQNGQPLSGRDIEIQESTSNSESSGLIRFNPNNTNPSQPNQDGTFGREPFIGLAHEMGHTWDRNTFGSTHTNAIWYTIKDNNQTEDVYVSEKYATWFENGIRAENKLPLREFYSFDVSSGHYVGDERGRLLSKGTRQTAFGIIPINQKFTHTLIKGSLTTYTTISLPYIFPK